jgi:hypothetical protein
VRTNRISFEIAALLCAKLAALTILYFAFFSPARQPHVDARALSHRLLSSSSRP